MAKSRKSKHSFEWNQSEVLPQTVTKIWRAELGTMLPATGALDKFLSRYGPGASGTSLFSRLGRPEGRLGPVISQILYEFRTTGALRTRHNRHKCFVRKNESRLRQY